MSNVVDINAKPRASDVNEVREAMQKCFENGFETARLMSMRVLHEQSQYMNVQEFARMAKLIALIDDLKAPELKP